MSCTNELCADAVHAFAEQGFLILPQFYSQAQMQRFAEAYRCLIQTTLQKAEIQASWQASDFVGDEFDAGMRALEACDHRYIRELYDATAHLPALLGLVSDARLQQHITQLLQQSTDHPLYLFKPRCLVAPPQDERHTYGWHQEVFYTIPKSRFVQIWAPLIRPSNKANGAIEICVGSNQAAIAKQQWLQPKDRVLQIIVDENEVANYPQQTVELGLGDLLVFKSTLFHRSGTNTSAEHRYSMVCMFHDYANPEFATPYLHYDYAELSPEEFYQQIQNHEYKDRGLYR